MYLRVRTIMQRTDTLSGRSQYRIRLEWQYMNTDLIVRKEYFTYDINSLIADIGGYLGLLLGYSILSIYEWIIRNICKAVKKVEHLLSVNCDRG